MNSTVNLLYEATVNAGDWVDLTAHCLVDRASFDSASNANPGTCEVILRDPDRDMPNLVTGHRLRLLVDGQVLWAGFTLIKGRGSFFPAGDGRENTKARRWTLRGTDNNVLLDRRVLRYPTNYLTQFPKITTDRMDGWLIRYALANYTDIPTADPWLDITTEIDDVAIPSSDGTGHITATHPWMFPQQGTKVRGLFEDANLSSLAVYYLGPDDKFHYHAYQTRECPWGFSDRPNRAAIIGSGGFEGAYWGFRELEADEDGSQFGTDAFVWGGSQWAGTGKTVFHRATDETIEALHGKWQIPETHFDETHFKLQAGVTQRAHQIVYGEPGSTAAGHTDPTGGGAAPGTVVGEGPRGMRFPGWTYSFTWFSRDVPDIAGVPRHLYPGDIVPIQLWTYSEDGGVTPFSKYLPLRALRLSFSALDEGKALVKFQGTFDLRNEDSMFLWKWLRSREPVVSVISIPVADDSASDVQYGSAGSFALLPPGSTNSADPPDGVSVVYHIPVGYIPGTSIVTKNGIEQLVDVHYTESNPDLGEVTFTSVPAITDVLWMRCRTLAGALNNYYISPTGSDTTGDGSFANPWLTIQKWIDSAPVAGDALNMRGGVYDNAPYSWCGHGKPVLPGTAAAPITIRAYAGEVPIFSGGSGPLLGLYDACTYVTIDGIQITGRAVGSAGYINVGGWEPGGYLTLHITVRNFKFTLPAGQPANEAHCIYMGSGCQYVTVEDGEFVGPGAGNGGGGGFHSFSDGTANHRPPPKDILCQRTIHRNFAYSALYVWDDGTHTTNGALLHNTFINNARDIRAERHGALLIQDNATDGPNDTNWLLDPNDPTYTTLGANNFFSQTFDATGHLLPGNSGINGASDGSDAGAL